MNKDKVKNYGIGFLLAVLSIMSFCIVHNNISSKNLEPEIVTIHDTTFVTEERIKEKEKIKYITKFDTFKILETDTIRDTIYMSIPIEHKQYRDTFLTDTTRTILDIKYSGYKAELDALYVHSSFTQKERIKVKTSGFGQFVGAGLQLGYGASVNPVNKTFQPSPYIGVGITYGWGYHW